MKAALFLACILFAQFGFAKSAATTTASPYTQETLSDGKWSGENSIYFHLIPYAKGTGLGFSYEKNLAANLGIGGNLTFLSEDDATATTPALPGLTAFGGNVRLHFPVQFFDFYVAPGLSIMMMKLGTLDKTTIGASMAIGGLAQFNKSFALGLELTAIQPWFNKEFYAIARTYYINSDITARFTF